MPDDRITALESRAGWEEIGQAMEALGDHMDRLAGQWAMAVRLRAEVAVGDHTVGLRRKGQSWIFVVRGTDGSVIPLRDASKEVRLSAVEALPRLAKELVRRRVEIANRVHEAYRRVDDMLAHPL